MTRLPPIVTAGKARDRHNYAAIFAAAGRTWSVPHRRGKTWVQVAGSLKCRRKLLVLKPRVSVPKYCFAGGESSEFNSLIINVFLKRQGTRLQAPSQDLRLIPFSIQISKMTGYCAVVCSATSVRLQEDTCVLGISERNALARTNSAATQQLDHIEMVIALGMGEADRQVRSIVLAQAPEGIE